MGVTEIMHTNFLYTGFFTSSEHFMVQEMFGVREKPVVRLNIPDGFPSAVR